MIGYFQVGHIGAMFERFFSGRTREGERADTAGKRYRFNPVIVVQSGAVAIADSILSL